MRRTLFALSLCLVLLGFGCTEVKDPDLNYYTSRASGYSFAYPKEHWSISFPELGNGVAGNGLPHVAYEGNTALIFYGVAAKSDLTQSNPTLVIAEMKYPGSTLLSSQPFTNPGQTIMKTKSGKQEYTWITYPIPKQDATVVVEVLNPIRAPYPPKYEEGVEQILKTLRAL